MSTIIKSDKRNLHINNTHLEDKDKHNLHINNTHLEDKDNHTTTVQHNISNIPNNYQHYCISPIDGRYNYITKSLSNYFSEFNFFKYRLFIELKYFCELSKFIPELSLINDTDRNSIMNIWSYFSDTDYHFIKNIEKTTQHDIKALEYFIQQKFTTLGYNNYISFIHFGLTSQDINTSANILALKDCMNNDFIPIISNLLIKIELISSQFKNDTMLSFTHGQPAVPTTMGKELFVFSYRLQEQLNNLTNMKFTTKFGGAIGNFNAHYYAYPKLNWNLFADKFIDIIGLKREQYTTQISNYDNLCNIFNQIKTINCIINDLNIDCWLYISKGYLKLKIVNDEIGSSTMPQKVNPIHFENSEGNIHIANSIIEGITRKLPVSRLQRDLTDSTILRNIGTIIAYSYISYTSTIKGLDKIDINRDIIYSDLLTNYNVLTEAVQTILRKHKDNKAYEKLHEISRNNFDYYALNLFINNLPENIKNELININHESYRGNISLL
uniref:Adenylosuccinate lyase n=1 Tax=viral metagenome TaxID=1070528 RepID=A0A6C0BTY9_9ZZZZ